MKNTQVEIRVLIANENDEQYEEIMEKVENELNMIDNVVDVTIGIGMDE